MTSLKFSTGDGSLLEKLTFVSDIQNFDKWIVISSGIRLKTCTALVSLFNFGGLYVQQVSIKYIKQKNIIFKYHVKGHCNFLGDLFAEMEYNIHNYVFVIYDHLQHRELVLSAMLHHYSSQEQTNQTLCFFMRGLYQKSLKVMKKQKKTLLNIIGALEILQVDPLAILFSYFFEF